MPCSAVKPQCKAGKETCGKGEALHPPEDKRERKAEIQERLCYSRIWGGLKLSSERDEYGVPNWPRRVLVSVLSE